MDGVLYSITPVHAIPFNFVLHYSIKRLPCDPPRGHFYPAQCGVPRRGLLIPLSRRVVFGVALLWRGSVLTAGGAPQGAALRAARD